MGFQLRRGGAPRAPDRRREEEERRRREEEERRRREDEERRERARQARALNLCTYWLNLLIYFT